MLWILQDHYSQNWDYELASISKVIDGPCRNECDKHFEDEVDGIPASEGYIYIEVKIRQEGLYIACDLDVDIVYDRICDSLVAHYGILDLRGLDGVRIG